MHRRVDRGDSDRPQWRRRPVGNHEPRGGVHRQRRLHKTSSTELARRIGTKPRERKARRRWQPVMKSRDTEWALSRSIIHYWLLRLLAFPDLRGEVNTPEYDVVVTGSGPAGQKGAIAAGKARQT